MAEISDFKKYLYHSLTFTSLIPSPISDKMYGVTLFKNADV